MAADKRSWTIEKFHAGLNRADFDCGSAPLNDYFKRYANQNQKLGIGSVYAAVDDEDGKTVYGYYVISSGAVNFEELPEELSKKLPRYPVPIIRIGRLAVALSAQGKGLGAELLMDAVRRACSASQDVAAFAIVVDAKDEKAAQFYEHFGFLRFQVAKQSLFLPISTARTELLD